MSPKFSRRQALRLISLSAGATTFVSVSCMKQFFLNAAQARAASKSILLAANEVVSEEVYKGRRFKVVTKRTDETPQTLQDGTRKVDTPYEAPVELLLDDRKINIVRDKKTKKYSTELLPFAEYDSARSLAIDLIDLKVQAPDSL